MTFSHLTTVARSRTVRVKPKKPSAAFPLFAHNNGQWAKKVRGKICFFGVWSDSKKALERWLDVKDDLLAGRSPRAQDDGLTMRDLANRYLTHKRHLLDTGELSERTWQEYYSTCERLMTAFGKDRMVNDLRADDFETLRAAIARTWGPVRLGNEIQRTRSVFKYGFDAGLIDKPVRFGPGFKRPSVKTLRKLRAEKGPRLFEAKQIRTMMDACGGQLKAMILLGINCGFGNEDVATLRIDALDLGAGWLQHPRPKTGIERKCKLWPETVRALKEVLAERKAPSKLDFVDLVFITKYGQSWANSSFGSAITHEMDKLLKELQLKRQGISFYALRHSFATVAGETRDQVAVNSIMGHVDSSMAAHYRERISNERMEAVAVYVRHWLFG